MNGPARHDPVFAAGQSNPTVPPTPDGGALREALGKEVRRVWIAWARTQPNPKASWLVEWDGLSEPDKEVYRQIGERLYGMGLAATPAATPGDTLPATTGTPAGAEAALALKEGAEWALTALRRDLQSARDFDGYYGPHRKAVALLVAAGVHAKPETYTGL